MDPGFLDTWILDSWIQVPGYMDPGFLNTWILESWMNGSWVHEYNDYNDYDEYYICYCFCVQPSLNPLLPRLDYCRLQAELKNL